MISQIMSDPAAVAQLVVKHRHEMVAFLYGLVPDPHAVEDIFQEICVVAVRKAAEFQDGTNFVAWARAIARHKVREHFRNRNGVLLADEFLDGLERAFDEASAGLEVDLRKEALRRCLDKLQKGSRQILSLRYEEGLDPTTIAARIGKSRVAVNSLLQRIRETLKECVERRNAAAGV
jgi:RNA polymerase sigma-70 factor (ECF subfamily)